MDWKTYREDLAQARFDPAFQQRVLRELDALAACRKDKHIMNRMTRYGLIAAILVLVIGISAFAAAYTAHDSARDHLGISKTDPIPEYTEYATEPYTEPSALPQARLLSTVCSGDTVIANVEFAPIPESYAGRQLRELSEVYALDLDGEGFHRWNMEIIDYDGAAQAAIAKITLKDVDREAITLHFRLEQDFVMTPVIAELTFPAVMGQGLSVQLSRTFRTDIGEGCIYRVDLTAAEIKVSYRVPGYDQWEGAVAYSEELHEEGEFQEEYWNAYRTYTITWFDGVGKALEGASITFADGTTQELLALPSPYAPHWAPPETGDVLGTELYATRLLSDPLDLRTVIAITIGGVTYSIG